MSFRLKKVLFMPPNFILLWFYRMRIHRSDHDTFWALVRPDRSCRVRCKSIKLSPWGFLKLFSQRLRIFKQRFTRLLAYMFVYIYGKLSLQNFIQLSLNMTKFTLIHYRHRRKFGKIWVPNSFPITHRTKTPLAKGAPLALPQQRRITGSIMQCNLCV